MINYSVSAKISVRQNCERARFRALQSEDGFSRLSISPPASFLGRFRSLVIATGTAATIWGPLVLRKGRGAGTSWCEAQKMENISQTSFIG